jgi:hypothetical protein
MKNLWDDLKDIGSIFYDGIKRYGSVLVLLGCVYIIAYHTGYRVGEKKAKARVEIRYKYVSMPQVPKRCTPCSTTVKKVVSKILGRRVTADSVSPLSVFLVSFLVPQDY